MSNGSYKVYLAGAITGLTAEVAEDWREYAKRQLAYREELVPSLSRSLGLPGPATTLENISTGIVGYSPMRAKDYLVSVGVLSGRPEAYDQYVLSTAQGITARDSWDVATADLILINLLGAEKVSIGTVLEIGMGYAQRKPMVAAMEEDNVHVHAMVNSMIPWIVDDLDYAIDLVKAILLPDGIKVPA